MPVTVEQLGQRIDTRPLLRTVRARLDDLVDALDDADWHRPTVCPGWQVRDLVAHLIGDDLGRLSRTHDGEPGPGPHPGEDLPHYVDRLNDEWVVALRRLSPPVLLSLLGAGGAEVVAFWDALDLDAPTGGVSWAGLDDGPAWMDLARDTTEYWIHEQQIREAVDRPLHDAAEAATVIDVLVRGLPYALRSVDAPDGAVVVVRADDVGAAWLVGRREGRWWFGRRTETDRLAGMSPPHATVSADAATIWRRWSRHPAGRHGAFARDGYAPAAAAVVDHLAIIRPDD
jgi:uncharacterized protein (TIGR03083 family)